jgi:outer membrane protein OmpA-like peptidoglycan-associated protein
MRRVRSTRSLKPTEIELARKVFGNNMPAWSQIGITDGLGSGDTVWTHTRELVPFLPDSTYQYFINFGDASQVDLSVDSVSLSRYVSGYGADEVDDVFMHEMTHIWQYSRTGANWASIAARCVYAQKAGAGYKFQEGDPWSDYNLEQQASIVEAWNRRDRKEDDVLYPYIYYIVNGAGRKNWNFTDKWWGSEANLAQLQVMLDSERVKLPDDTGHAVQSWSKDDSFLVVMNGDVLFEFGKADLKPTADPVLQKAWTMIQGNPRRQKVFINGHTDSVGNDAVNQPLSEKRAQAVADWFTRRGYLTAAVISVQGFGKTQPIAPNTTAEGRAKNRRVEIYLRNS